MKILPVISKIRFTNVIYENGTKRFNDDIFDFDGNNGVILLENGGGKTVFIQTAIQAILPHSDLGERKIRNTLSLEGGAAHIAIEWILNDKPRRYAITAVTLFLTPTGLNSLRYVYDYSLDDEDSLENLPFVKINQAGDPRPVSRQEIQEYYQYMQSQKLNAHTFNTIKDFHYYIEENFHIIPSEWSSIARINGAEGDVEKFFENCKTTSQLVDQLLIPVIEDTLVGNGTEDFVQIFERQREHFKKHRELRGKIDESRNIEQKISHYVNEYNKFNELEENMLHKKKETKTIYDFLQEEHQKIMAEINHLLELQDIQMQEKRELKRKEASFELAIVDKELKEKKASYEIIRLNYVEIEQKLNTKASNLQNLEIAELKATIKHYEEKSEILIKQLGELDTDHNIIVLKDRLKENSCLLIGYFTKEKESLEKQQILWENHKSKYDNQLKVTNKKLGELQAKKQRLIEARAGYIAEIKSIEKNLEEIKKEILINPLNETVAEEYPKWRKRTEEIEKLNITYKNHLKELKEKNEHLTKDILELNNNIQELVENTTAKSKDLSLIKNKHNEILSIIKNLRLEWYYLDSVYLKEESIIQYIEERWEKTKTEKEKLLERERLSYRWLDFYGGNEYFTPDPLLEKWINSWGSQFNLLELGTQYIEKAAVSLNKSIAEIYINYPLWPLVIITSKSELIKLTEKIEEQRKNLSFPTIILSQEEATNLLIGDKEIQERYIYPLLWEENIDKEKFQLWQKGLKESAEKATEERKSKEQEEENWRNKLRVITEFLSNYPYDKYTQLTEELKSLETDLELTKKILIKKQQEEISINKEIQDYMDKLNTLEHEANHLGRKIMQAANYFAKEKEKEQIHNQFYQADDELDIVEKDISICQKDIENISFEIQETGYKILKINHQKENILNDPSYKEVKNYSAKFSNKNKMILLEERKYLNDMLDEKQKGRGEIERQLQDVENNKIREIELLERKYSAATYPIEENIEYPYNGKAIIEELLNEVKQLKNNIDNVLPLLKQEEDKYKKTKHEYETKLGFFYNEFDEIFHFTQPLPSIKDQLSKEKQALADKEKYLEASYNRLEKELEDINNNIHYLDIENGRYSFLLSSIESTLLPAALEQELPYNRKKVIANLINELEDITKNLETYRNNINIEKEQFIVFLESNVNDIKLREMAVSGIRNKNTFKVLLEWQENMNKTLNRVIRIHEKNMMEHDKELNQFIQYLYTYLSTLADELRSIPKNTKIKIDGNWKEIFQIQVPSWDEEEGKIEIRKHIDWMVAKLESDEFLDNEGKEDLDKVKKTIEKWLLSKQLLNIILIGKDIKVKCRKVTNDGKVTNTYYSWESSNQWSGGEKWSKNMALFLGILNYVAEKKQHIMPNQKRHRTVILDNPFGKASSDHVLSPVFFIAEQLGFQFITLTAHGEGQFISNYFPVVYSCKLRPSVGGDTSILTKEKIINYAFLKDKT